MGESKEYLTLPEENGSINISEEVIAAIAVGAVRDVDGVAGMMTGTGGMVSDLMGKRSVLKGVKVDLSTGEIQLDLYLNVQFGHPIPEVAESAQKAVSSAVEAMTGCKLGAVNIHVGGVTIA